MLTHPALLLFLPLALLPIVLHLITLYRLRTVELSTFRFLMDSYLKQRRRARLIEWLLMLLRTAFVALVVFVIARPVAQRFGFLFNGGGPRDVAIVVDCGASMAVTSAGRSSLDRARDAARSVVGLLNPSDRVVIVRAGREAEVIARGVAEQSQPLLAAIESAAIAPSSGDIAGSIDTAFAALGRAPSVLYVITDANRRSWSDVPQNESLKRMQTASEFVVLNVGSTAPTENIGVVGQAPHALRPIVGLPVVLHASVVNHSRTESVDTTVAIIVDDEQVEQKPVTLAPGQTQTVAMTFTPQRAGLVEGRFELPADAFSADDAYLFTLNVEPRLRVLLVTDGAAAPNDRAPRADDPAFYIEAALRSPLHAQRHTPGTPGTLGSAPGNTTVPADERRIAESLSIARVTPDALAASDLSQADVVVLADTPLDAERGAMLRRYMEAGGGVLALPGPRANLVGYNDLLLGAAFDAQPDRLPRLLPPVGDPDDPATFVTVTPADPSHPILRALTEEQADAFATTRLYRRLPILIPELQRHADDGAPVVDASSVRPPRVLLRASDESPAMIDMAISQGTLVVASFAATPQWSNLPLRPQFVPLLLRSVAYLRRAAPAQTVAAVAPGEPAPIHVSELWRDASVQAIDPTGKSQAIDLVRDGVGRQGAMLRTSEKGYYRFTVQPRVDGAPERVEMGFAVNLDAQAFDLTSLDEASLRQAVAPVEPVYLQSSPSDPAMAEQLAHKNELWRVLIWLVLAVMAAEFLLATLRGGDRDRAGQSAMGEAAPTRLRSVLRTVGWEDLENAGRSRQ